MPDAPIPRLHGRQRALGALHAAADDVIITTPSKCGTTWMQTIVGMLLHQTTDLPPIGTISPWLDMQIRTEDEVFGLLERRPGGASSRPTRRSTACPSTRP